MSDQTPGICKTYPLRVSYPRREWVDDQIRAFMAASLKCRVPAIVDFHVLHCHDCGGWHLFVNQAQRQDKR